MDAGTEIPLPGVRAMHHTADLALEVEAPDAAELLRRAAAGMAWLILENEPRADGEVRRLRASADDAPGLLREWLRELLYWHEADGFSASGFEFESLTLPDDPGERAELEAVVRGGPDPAPPVREIKGVTLHGLAAERRDGGWYARVIFDV